MQNDFLYSDLGKTIKSYRIRLNMTQSELAEGICSTSHITHIENGFRTPNAIILFQLAERLKVPMDLLYQPFGSKLHDMLAGLLITIASEGVYDKLNEYVNFIESNYTTLLKSDRLFIETIKIYMNTMKTKEYLKGAKAIEQLLVEYSLHRDYITDTEFALECASYWLHYLAGNIEYAFLKYKEAYYNIPKIISYKRNEAVIKFFTQITVVSIERGSYDLALRYIEEGIDMCKNNSSYILLPEFIFHKGEAYCYKGDSELGQSLIEDSIKMSDLIYVQNDYFLKYIHPRIEKIESIKI